MPVAIASVKPNGKTGSRSRPRRRWAAQDVVLWLATPAATVKRALRSAAEGDPGEEKGEAGAEGGEGIGQACYTAPMAIGFGPTKIDTRPAVIREAEVKDGVYFWKRALTTEEVGVVKRWMTAEAQVFKFAAWVRRQGVTP